MSRCPLLAPCETPIDPDGRDLAELRDVFVIRWILDIHAYNVTSGAMKREGMVRDWFDWAACHERVVDVYVRREFN